MSESQTPTISSIQEDSNSSSENNAESAEYITDDDNKSNKLQGPKTKKFKKSQQKYRKAWESQYKWLKPISGNSFAASCTTCCDIKFRAELGVIARHGRSKKHMALVKTTKTQPKIIDLVKETVLEKKIKRAELLVCAFLAEHNVPFLALDHLIPILQKCFSDSAIAKSMSVARTKATGIVKNVIARNEFENVVQDLKTSKFSLLVDESTDVGTTKNMAVCVRYYSEEEKSIKTKFLTPLQVFSKNIHQEAHVGATGEKIYMDLIAFLQKNDIPFDNLIGFASDGCNVMFGVNNSVVSRLKSDFPGIFTLKCICHSLHLCASEACKILPRECEGMARDVFNFFNHSSKRQAEFLEFQEFCHLEPHKILRPAQTRWLSLSSVVKRIVEQWCALELYFRLHFEEQRLNQSEQILNALTNKKNKLFFLFLEWVLPKFTALNAYFQSEKVVLADLYNKMSQTYKDLLSIYMETNYINKCNLSELNPEDSKHFLLIQNMYLGISVLQHLNDLANEDKMDFLVRCQQFLITACIQIKKRFDFSDMFLEKIEILNPKWPNKPNTIFPLMQLCTRITKNLSLHDLQIIDDEWRLLILTKDGEQFTDLSIDQHWSQIKSLQDHDENYLYKNVAQFVLSVLSFPHSNASVEKVFSKVNLIKTRVRNRLVTDTVNALLLTAQSVKKNGSCLNFEPTDKMISEMKTSQIYSRSAGSADVPTAEILDDVTFEE